MVVSLRPMNMKPIVTAPRDGRELLLGYSDYGTTWRGRWNGSAWEPKCRPDNPHPDTTHEHADCWLDLTT